MNILLRLLAIATGLGLCACGTDSAESPATQYPSVAVQPPADTPNTPAQTQPEIPGDTATPGDHPPGDDQSEEPPSGNGPPSDGTPEEDPPTEEPPTQNPPADDPPSVGLPGLTLVEPANAKQLSPEGKMVFAVDETTDITQVAGLIQLRDATGTSIVPTRSEIDEGLRTITVLPVRQLEVGARYSVELKQAAHDSLMALSTDDVQAIHLQVPDLVVTKHVFYDQDGEITSIILVQESDISSLPAYVNLEGPGEDGEWLKGNDDVQRYRMKTIDDEFGSYTEIEYQSPGEDGQWFDDNDIPFRAVRYVFHASGALKMVSRSRDPGGNGEWFTDDDDYYDFLVVDLDDNGRPLRLLTASSLSEAGADKTWFTEDDEISGYLRHEYDDRFRTRLISFDGPGDDGVWYSSEDSVEKYHAYRYTPRGRLEFDITVSGPGVDGKWLDDNDVTRAFYRYANTYRSIESDLNNRRDYFASTTDIPLSQDLVQASSLHHYVIRLHDTLGRPTFSGRMTRRGQNHQWFDEDDDFLPGEGGYANETFYTPTGDNVESVTVSYSAPGDDNLWRTGNEPVKYIRYNVLDTSGRRINQETYRSAGEDGDWLRRDDNPLHYTIEYDTYFED